MNKNIIILGLLMVAFLSGCIEQKSTVRDEISPDKETIPMINATRFGVDYDSTSELKWIRYYYKFKEGNNTCYSYNGNSAALTCVHDE